MTSLEGPGRLLQGTAEAGRTVVGQYTDWTPLHERDRLFPEDLDKTDPWQFKNVRVLW